MVMISGIVRLSRVIVCEKCGCKSMSTTRHELDRVMAQSLKGRRLSRDPFSRSELWVIRDYSCFTGSRRGCDWCGQTHEGPGAHPYLNHYWREYDSGRRAEINGRFCSVSCMRSYNH